MAEAPDFDQIARVAVMTFYDTTPRHGGAELEAVKNIAARLRLVWNARGAADIAKLEAAIPDVWATAHPAGPLTRALRSLDR